MHEPPRALRTTPSQGKDGTKVSREASRREGQGTRERAGDTGNKWGKLGKQEGISEFEKFGKVWGGGIWGKKCERSKVFSRYSQIVNTCALPLSPTRPPAPPPADAAAPMAASSVAWCVAASADNASRIAPRRPARPRAAPPPAPPASARGPGARRTRRRVMKRRRRNREMRSAQCPIQAARARGAPAHRVTLTRMQVRHVCGDAGRRHRGARAVCGEEATKAFRQSRERAEQPPRPPTPPLSAQQLQWRHAAAARLAAPPAQPTARARGARTASTPAPQRCWKGAHIRGGSAESFGTYTAAGSPPPPPQEHGRRADAAARWRGRASVERAAHGASTTELGDTPPRVARRAAGGGGGRRGTAAQRRRGGDSAGRRRQKRRSSRAPRTRAHATRRRRRRRRRRAARREGRRARDLPKMRVMHPVHRVAPDASPPAAIAARRALSSFWQSFCAPPSRACDAPGCSTTRSDSRSTA